MTRQEAIERAPRSRGGYWFSLVMGAVFAVLFLVFAVLLRHKSVAVAAFSVGMALAMVVMAAQAAERLFRPEHAAMRSASLSDQQRLKIKRTRMWLTACFIAGGAIAVVVFCLPGHAEHRVYEDIQLIMWVPFMLAQVLADVAGETMDRGNGQSRSETNLLLQGSLTPVRSEHWGEQG